MNPVKILGVFLV